MRATPRSTPGFGGWASTPFGSCASMRGSARGDFRTTSSTRTASTACDSSRSSTPPWSSQPAPGCTCSSTTTTPVASTSSTAARSGASSRDGMPTGRTCCTSSRTSRSPGVPTTGGDAAVHAQEELFWSVRAMAPETHVTVCSFANTKVVGRSISDVASALEIEWSNASLGFHCYETGGTSAPIVAARERFAVVCTEVDVPTSSGGDPHVVPMDGEPWATQTLERLGISWFAWRANGPEEVERNFQHGFLADARRRGYAWVDGRLSGTALLRARVALQRCVIRANKVPLLRRANAVPYSVATSMLGRLCARTSGVHGCYVRGLAEGRWTPGLSDIDPLVVLERRPDARRRASGSAGLLDRLPPPAACSPDARRAGDRERSAPRCTDRQCHGCRSRLLLAAPGGGARAGGLRRRARCDGSAARRSPRLSLPPPAMVLGGAVRRSPHTSRARASAGEAPPRAGPAG